MQPSSPICRVPAEILENIALHIVQIDPQGPPAAILPLLSTCKQINTALTADNSLWAGVFSILFDVGPPRRRFGDTALYASNLADQLKKYCINIQRISRGAIFSPHIEEIFWTSFVMLSENDGKNMAQLMRVGLDDLVDRFVRIRMYESRWDHRGWPADSVVNSLALWLLWLTSDRDKLVAESEQRRQQIVSIVLPYVILDFRYPTSLAPPNHFFFPLPDVFERRYPHSFVTPHGPYPLFRDPNAITTSFVHYGTKIKISHPLITIPAKLIYFSRREAVPFGIPSHLPVDRAHAFQLGFRDVAPTQADIAEINAHINTRTAPPTKWNWWEDLTEEELTLEDSGTMSAALKSASSKWDCDWMRWVYCSNPWVQMTGKGNVYNLGSLAGLWHGRMLFPNEVAYMELVSTPDYPPTFSEKAPRVSTVPVYMRIREHHCISPQTPVDVGGFQHGIDDELGSAYFPPMQMNGSGTDVVITANGENSRYETYHPDRPNSHDENTCTMCLSSYLAQYDADFAAVGMDVVNDEEPDEFADVERKCGGVVDVIFTGETDAPHGQAWNHFTYVGRVRPWDGLIAILRIPRDRRLGRVVFYGYLIGGQNFVGNWRVAHVDPGVPAWGSAFSMSRRDV